MKIPFTKAHGAHNDFLLTWRDQLPAGLADMASVAVAICDRHTGVGADGWLLVSRSSGVRENATEDASIELWNSDGSRSEISGNGTRCAAALLAESNIAQREVRIGTGAGLKHLRLLARDLRQFTFEMNMGAASIEELHATIEGRDCTILNVGNPQCVFFVDNFDFDWQALGARVERHPRFPNRTNVSFVRVVDGQTVAGHNLDVRFFERGAGETMSSGTGSTGAAAAAVARGLAETPVRVLTPAGALDLRWEQDNILLAGPAELVAAGEFFWKGN
ncbi:MAG TPA: diaminopimelate epimerase [Bryobacteraceae bacterium]|jgi:diaminopimelate epimerase|nr:diaminopimelate epimerase [Bryobacteraceae bacterium]